MKMDFGALWGGYHSDFTRTVAFGEIAAELRRIYEVVRQAQAAGVDAVRAGAVGGDVDAASRRVVEDAGYGERFSHGLGHGVGLEIHEGPGLRRGGTDELPAGRRRDGGAGRLRARRSAACGSRTWSRSAPTAAAVMAASTKDLIEL